MLSACRTRSQNIIQGLLVNGSLGRVVGFYKPREALAMGAEIGLPDNQQGLRRTLGVEDEKKGGAGANAERGTVLDNAQSEQREAKLKAILATNQVWPCVQFHSGPLMLCVPLSFEVINADGNIEAVREQVSISIGPGLPLEDPRTDYLCL